MIARGVIAALAIAGAASTALADPVPTALVEGGMVVRWGAREHTSDLQVFGGVTGEPMTAHALGGTVFVGFGVRAAYGGVESTHALQLDAMPSHASGIRTVLAPELRLGLAWAHPRAIYAYLGVAPIWVSTFARPEARPWIPELGNRRGVQLALGAATPGFHHLLLEASWQHVDATDRAGVGVGAAF